MNTIVNITGITLKCLGTSDENVMLTRRTQNKKPSGYYKNLITVSYKENTVEYKRQWTFLNKERKKLLDLKNRDRINFMRRKNGENEEVKKRRAEQKRKYGKKHRKKITQKYLERRRKDFNFKLLTTLRTGLRHFLKGTKKCSTTKELLGMNIDQFWNHLESKFKPGMTKENHGKIWHIDHIIPCAAFDQSNPEDQKVCWHYTNLQPLFVHENLSKGAKIIK